MLKKILIVSIQLNEFPLCKNTCATSNNVTKHFQKLLKAASPK